MTQRDSSYRGDSTSVGDNYLARLGKRRWWQARVVAVHCRTSSSSTRKSTRTMEASYHDDDLDGAGAAAGQRHTGRSLGRADPSPCSMSRDKNSQVVDGRGVCSRRQDPPSKDLSDDR